MVASSCSWDCELNEDGSAVRLEFNEIDENGAVQYVTAFSPYVALSLAEALLNKARQIMSAQGIGYDDEEDVR